MRQDGRSGAAERGANSLPADGALAPLCPVGESKVVKSEMGG